VAANMLCYQAKFALVSRRAVTARFGVDFVITKSAFPQSWGNGIRCPPDRWRSPGHSSPAARRWRFTVGIDSQGSEVRPGAVLAGRLYRAIQRPCRPPLSLYSGKSFDFNPRSAQMESQRVPFTFVQDCGGGEKRGRHGRGRIGGTLDPARCMRLQRAWATRASVSARGDELRGPLLADLRGPLHRTQPDVQELRSG
jgi:hypothetical protein